MTQVERDDTSDRQPSQPVERRVVLEDRPGGRHRRRRRHAGHGRTGAIVNLAVVDIIEIPVLRPRFMRRVRWS